MKVEVTRKCVSVLNRELDCFVQRLRGAGFTVYRFFNDDNELVIRIGSDDKAPDNSD